MLSKFDGKMRFNTLRRPTIWVLLMVVQGVCVGWVSAPLYGQEKKSQNTATETSGTAKEGDAGKENDLPAFVRILRDDEDEPVSLQVAIGHYVIEEGEFRGAKIDLIGAVHIGAKSYYGELNKRFKKYDALLYELVADPSVNKPHLRDRSGFNPIGSMQTGMKDVLQLKFQLDEIDYSARNFVHADMSPSEFGQDMSERKDGLVNMFARMMGAGFATQSSKRGNDAQAKMMAALLTKDPVLMRIAMAEQFESMEIQMAGIGDAEGKSTIITERNGKAFAVMQDELRSGKKSLGIFYGAGHLSDMHRRLIRDYHAKQIGIEWLDAWDLKNK